LIYEDRVNFDLVETTTFWPCWDYCNFSLQAME